MGHEEVVLDSCFFGFGRLRPESLHLQLLYRRPGGRPGLDDGSGEVVNNYYTTNVTNVYEGSGDGSGEGSGEVIPDPTALWPHEPPFSSSGSGEGSGVVVAEINIFRYARKRLLVRRDA